MKRLRAFGLLPLLGVLTLSVLFAGCQDSGTAPKEAPPEIAYATPVSDTAGLATEHGVVSTGGAAFLYLVTPALPVGLVLDPVTGRISGTPLEASAAANYSVIATGHGGSDTAVIRIKVVEPVPATVFLSVGLAAAPGYTLSRVVVTLTSGVDPDAVVRDTILPGTSGLTASAASAQSVLLTHALKSRRDWKAVIRAADARDSLLYSDSVSIDTLRMGESRAVTTVLSPRYVTYVAKFAFPDSLASPTSGNKQRLNVKRLVMIVNGDTLADSVRAGYFASAPAFHLISGDYVKAGEAQARLAVYGEISGWPVDRPLFNESFVVNSGSETVSMPTLPWTGPGSPSDPNYDPSPAGGAFAGLAIEFGKLGLVEVNPDFPENPLPKMRAR